MTGARRCLLVMAAAVALALPARAQDESRELRDAWYALYLNGQKAGHMHERVVELGGDGAPIYGSRIRQEFTFARQGLPMRVASDTLVREDADGHLIAFRQRTAGAMSMQVRGKVEGGELVVTSGAGPGAQTFRVPAHDGLCHWALSRLRDQRGYEPGATYTVEAFLAERPTQPAHLSVNVVGQEDVQVFEVTKRLWRAGTAIRELPGVATSEWYDEAGVVWLVRASMPGNLVFESRKTTRELATAPDEPAEVLIESIVRPDRPIPRPRQVERLRLRIVWTGQGEPTFDLPEAPLREVERTGDGWLVTLRSSPLEPSESYSLPYEGEEHAGLLGPNAWMETEDEAVRELARRAVGDETDARRAAGRIEQFVREMIARKDLSAGFATAAETAREPVGDCTEHAVLAAALARAAGMPGRVVAGLVYADDLFGTGEGAFGYHLWAEAYTGEWTPMDAALAGYDATHLALARSGLDSPDAPFELSSRIARVFGGIRIEVLQVGDGPSP